MFFPHTLLWAVVALISLAGAYKVIPFVEDGIPDHLQVATGPFVKIGRGYYYIETKTKKNWFDASESCRRIDAHLIAFETIEEWDLVNQYLFRNGIDNVYWTSGCDLAQQGKHNWCSTGEPLTLNIWYPGEPNNNNGNEHCDVLGDRRSSTNYNVLNDFNCAREVLYICEKSYPKTASFVIW
ncbi:C-type lectin 37Da-like [Drosophila biarmipes]|uniref:C-type lectin 37Da-like n=1 Tax=Drosophila biarmipes TaxID=125945 RepID=UPI0007E73B74|nr:C-type lectin 37Da-like [Drosophila biarmipes]